MSIPHGSVTNIGGDHRCVLLIFASMLDMTQGLFGKILLRPEPVFLYPEGPTLVASVGFFSLRDFVDPSVRWECVGVRP